LDHSDYSVYPEYPEQAMTDNSPPDLVARRQRYIELMKELHADSVDVLPAGSETAETREDRPPRGQGPANRHGMPKLPVGQRVVNNWPVLDLGDLPEVSTDEWRLEVGGLVENPVVLSWNDFLALPQTIDMSDFHCVTTWSRMDNNWEGVRFIDLMELVVPKDEAQVVFCTGYDKMPGTDIPYTTNLPLAQALSPDVLLVHAWEGAPLPREHGGPCRIITPRLYAWKGAKWIRKIELLDADRPGFWETRGYSNTAEPWFNDRYSSRS
jgi:DMSO/TMAO reductase YedYZ molybdopterin-dependent catalytic subunit